VSLRLQPDRPALSLGTVPKPSFRQNHQNSQKGTPATPSKSSPSRHPKSVITLSPLACAFAKNTRVGPSNPSRSSQHPANFELTPPHTITNCFVSPKNLTLVFPSHCELFCKNPPGGVSPSCCKPPALRVSVSARRPPLLVSPVVADLQIGSVASPGHRPPHHRLSRPPSVHSTHSNP
jgi:hypothetical protein